MKLINEVFALRHGEKIQAWAEPPEGKKWIAVMTRSVSMPDGPKQQLRFDGKPVESLAILACLQVEGEWQWLQLSPATKEAIGDYLLDGPERLPVDMWIYLSIV